MARAKTHAERLGEIGIEAMCAFIADGNSMREFCRVHNFSQGPVAVWLDDAANPERAERYARAREARADKLAEDILQISDDGLNDTYIDDDGKRRTDQDVIARSRLRVDSRKWLASKMFPRKYADRQVLAGDPDAPLNPPAKIDLSKLTDAELAAYVALQKKLEDV